jgi:hypothetical protein
MTEFDNAKLRRLDLTALLVFEAVLRTRKAADVAREIGVTPSSVSHALARLRDVFGDPLFIRRPHGLDPTFVARALEPQITAALDALRGAIAAPNAFDSRTSRHVVRMSGGDYELAKIQLSVSSTLARRSFFVKNFGRYLRNASDARQRHRDRHLLCDQLKQVVDTGLPAASEGERPGSAQQNALGAQGEHSHHIQSRTHAAIHQHGGPRSNTIDNPRKHPGG